MRKRVEDLFLERLEYYKAGFRFHAGPRNTTNYRIDWAIERKIPRCGKTLHRRSYSGKRQTCNES